MFIKTSVLAKKKVCLGESEGLRGEGKGEGVNGVNRRQ